jgi:hypothetical protein
MLHSFEISRDLVKYILSLYVHHQPPHIGACSTNVQIHRIPYKERTPNAYLLIMVGCPFAHAVLILTNVEVLTT